MGMTSSASPTTIAETEMPPTCSTYSVGGAVAADEVFVVLAGAATVEFEHPHAAPIVLASGSVVRLESGMRTIWTVRQTLRKVYVAP